MTIRKYGVLFLCGVLLAGCGQSGESDTQSLSIGVMPSVDAAPIYLAQEKGYFTDLDLDVEIRLYTNGTDRDLELQGKLVDGVVTDILGLITTAEAGYDVKATSSTDTAFPVLVNPQSVDKKEVSVGLAEVSVTNYLSDRFLQDYQVTKQFINALPQRLEMVQEGLLDMAIIPEPMASQGELNGLIKTMLVSEDAYSPNVLVFQTDVIENREAAMKKFYEAYNKAVADIAKDDQDIRTLLVTHLSLNPEIRDLITFPQYQEAQLFDEAHFDKIAAWSLEHLDIQSSKGYEALVDARFVR